MKHALLLAGLLLGIVTALGLGPVALAAGSPPSGPGPFLVIGPPWGGGVAARVEAAGGRLIGPATQPWAAIAFGAPTAAFREAGAWMILDPATIGVLCGREDKR